MYGPTTPAYGGGQYRPGAVSMAPGRQAPPQAYAAAGYGPPPQGMYGVPHPQQLAQQQQQQQYAAAQAGYRGQAPGGYAAQQPGYPARPTAGYAPAPAPQQQSRQPRHKGTIPPGQMVRVGHNAVRVERYLSEGGYAHVYLTSSEKPIYPPKRSGNTTKGRWGEKGYTEHCLKRIAFEDESVWNDVSKEIEVMKSLPPSPHLIQYLDSSHHRLPNGTHEVFILMEYCSGGGIIDFLNKRLRDRLKEVEILNIFTDVCEAVAAMHACSPPLLHRDLKIENVLSHPLQQPPTAQRPTPLIFKLCDFGSTTFPASHPPSSKAQADALAVDLNKHTTLQYRSPEMVEPMLGWAVGLPSDVWALGVLLYKLCYYTTPFEEHGTLAIVNAKYTFPQYPVYSARLQHLIASMLVEHPSRRPSVFEVLKVAHDMSGTQPLVDYPTPSNRPLPATLPSSPTKTRSQNQNQNVLDFTDGPSKQSSSATDVSLASTIQPQRRGRPTRDSFKSTAQPPAPQLPPVPHVPTAPAAQPGRPKLQVTGDGSPTKPRPASTNSRPYSIPSKPSVGKLQMGGSFERVKPPSSQGSVDAFGAPKQSRSSTSTSGFSDAFGVSTKSTVKSPTGFSDSFGAQSKSPASSVSGFSDSFAQSFNKSGMSTRQPPTPHLPQRSQSGFSDSFGVNIKPLKPTLAKAPTPESPKRNGARASPTSATSPRKPSPGPSSSIPDGELTFEQRFPSIETITSGHSGDDTSRSSPPVISSSPPTISDTAKDAADQSNAPRRQSIAMVNRTGGDLPTHLRVQLQPQPRSTHVTGTMFKNVNSVNTQSLRPPTPERSRETPSPTADYLNHMDDEDDTTLLPKVPQDFMDDEESESGKITLPSLRPQVSPVPPSGQRFGVPGPLQAQQAQASRKPPAIAAKPQATPGKLKGAAQRATLPPISAARPTTNINSDNWSPLEDMRNDKRHSAAPSSPSPGKANGLADSSDDDAGPESVTRQPMSPRTRPPRSPGIARRMSAFEPGALDMPPPRSPTKTSAPHTHGRQGGSRPHSMFASSTSSSPSAQSPISHTLQREVSPSDAPHRHMRRSSINNLVSRYESLTHGPSNLQLSPDKPAFTELSRSASVKSKPPAVATKPPMLRKPSGPRAPAGSSTTSAPPPVLPKPTTLRPAVKHGDAPTPDAYSRSSSGRTFPVSKAAPATREPSTGHSPSAGSNHGHGRSQSASSPDHRRGSHTSSRSSSPEKQQPVNLLIQRWNQGQLKSGAGRG